MKLKLTYRRRGGNPSDVVVTTEATATIADVARELFEADPLADRSGEAPADITLSVAPRGGRGVVLSPDRALGDVAIGSGSEVEVVTGVPQTGQQAAAAVVRVVGGPDAGREIALPLGSSVIGRDESADVVINDPFVSKRHARVDVSHVIELVDLNSANGIEVDGGVVTRLTVLPGQHVQLGDSRLLFALTAVPDAPDGGGSAVGPSFRRSPRVEARYAEVVHPRPAVPSEPTPALFSPLLLIAPVLMGTAMFLMMGSPRSLLMIAMAPLMMVTNVANNRAKNKREKASAIGRFNAQLTDLEATLSAERPIEHAVRSAESPSVAAVYDAVMTRSDLLWARRPEHWNFLTVRLGTASLESRNTIAPLIDNDKEIPAYAAQLNELEARFRVIEDLPVLESGPSAGAWGVAGDSQAFDIARSVLAQLAGLHSPSELVITSLMSPTEVPEFDWLRWLPHTSSPQSPISGVHLADSQATASQLLGELEEIVTARLGRAGNDAAVRRGPLDQDLGATAFGGTLDKASEIVATPVPVVVVLITQNAPVDRARVVQLAERGIDAGILPIWVSSSVAQLPQVCRTFIDTGSTESQASAHFVRHGLVVSPFTAEVLSREHAASFALAMAPLLDADAPTEDSTDLPTNVSMLSLLGSDLVDEHDGGRAVVERWTQNDSVHRRDVPMRPRRRAGSLRALVGQQGVDALHLDLRTEGPHALVGGTTGAGKSEFLQAWVLGMAAEYSPDRVTFLFVDYKGGAAFADCVRLPHCVGLVTDLSPHLVRRALTSLRAELHHREHLLNAKKAKDLLELERRGDPDAPPALVLVIDEFAALSKEVPEFVDGVVDIAQRGRSLGIHLIMATQRPAGVIKDNLRANTNLRVALRMADESDSSDVVGETIAAHFDPGTPGRAVAKTGPGRLTHFQSAYAGGFASETPDPVRITVHDLRVGAVDAWRRPEPEVEPEPPEVGPTDMVRLVDSIRQGNDFAEIPAPRKPWLEELSHVYDLSGLAPRTDSELMMGVADLPDQQAQEVVKFFPDVDGNLAIYGASGSGKSVLLRTLAIGAGITPRGGPVHVYCLDFAAGGLKILEPLPHVGAVVAGDDHDRVVRLLRTLRKLADERARTYPTVNAGSIEEFRRLADRPNEPRILLLLDNFGAFRDAYEASGVRNQWYAVLGQLLAEGRALGIHVVFTADRPNAVPGSIAASVSRRVVLRLADETGYVGLGVPRDILDDTSPPGRAVVGSREAQVAIFGGSGNVADQSQAISRLAGSIERHGAGPAPEIGALPTEVELASLPNEVDGFPVLGISDDTLEPVGFDPHGTFIIGGGPGSGRTNALVVLAQSVRRWKPEIALVYLSSRRSEVPELVDWDITATDLDAVVDMAKELKKAFTSDEPKRQTAIFVESMADFSQTAADGPLAELVRIVRRSDHLIVGDAETPSWGSIFPLMKEMRSDRKGILLQPDYAEGEAILRTAFPRSRRSEFPAGRGMAVMSGRATKVQMPLMARGVVPIGGDDVPQ